MIALALWLGCAGSPPTDSPTAAAPVVVARARCPDGPGGRDAAPFDVMPPLDEDGVICATAPDRLVARFTASDLTDVADRFGVHLLGHGWRWPDAGQGTFAGPHGRDRLERTLTRDGRPYRFTFQVAGEEVVEVVLERLTAPPPPGSTGPP